MAKAKILIVEDEGVIALLLEETLLANDYQIAGIAASGEDAIALVDRVEPDLVLMDIKLQGQMLGTEAALKITEKSQVPIIFLTAHSDPETQEQVFSSNPYGYILKPFKAENLLATIRFALEKKCYIDRIAKSEARLEAIFNASSIGIGEIDSDGTVIKMNHALQSILGLLGGRELEVNIKDLLRNNDIDASACLQQTRQEHKIKLSKPDGTDFWCKCACYPIMDSQANGAKALMIRDITDKIEAAHQLQMIRHAVEATNVGVVVANLEGEILYVNSAQAEMSGYQKEELLGKSVSTFAPSELNQGIPDHFIDNYERTSKNVRKDGTEFPVKLKSNLFFAQDGAHYIITTCENITEQIRLQEESEFHARLSSLGTMAAAMGHEINNPNGLIRINAELLQKTHSTIKGFCDEKIAQGFDEEQKLTETLAQATEMLDKIIDSSSRIRAVVDSLRDFSSPIKGLNKEVLSVRHIIEKSLSLVRPTISKHTDSIRLHFTGDGRVLGNPQKLQQVFVNLLLNAAQSLQSPDKGITITSDVDTRKENCIISIKDEGEGIPEEHLKEVKNPFFTTKQSAGGNGLGLAIVERIVNEHNGVLEISSVLGEGTEVKLSLPFAS